MSGSRISRRDVVIGASALAGGSAFATRVLAAAPPPSKITPELIAAAKKEGKVVWYTSIDLPLAEKIAKAFETKFPGVSCQVERTGAERVFQRIGQEYASNIHAVDAVNSSDASQFIYWKQHGMLAAHVPEDVAKFYPADQKDPDGMFASFRLGLSIIAYNTKMVKSDEAPKSYADILQPKWKGKIVKAHPGYSGTIMTATYELVHKLGWEFFEKLAKQNVLQVQSASVPPKKLALGERAVMADGNEYNIFQIMAKNGPVAPVYPTEGTPQIVGPTGMFKAAPHPNAAKLFCNYSFTRECQQLIIDVGGLRSMHAQAKDKPGHTSFKQIKLLPDNAAGVMKEGEQIKAHYVKLFHV
jgi:iron(III) transport system substrate-binding protein